MHPSWCSVGRTRGGFFPAREDAPVLPTLAGTSLAVLPRARGCTSTERSPPVFGFLPARAGCTSSRLSKKFQKNGFPVRADTPQSYSALYLRSWIPPRARGCIWPHRRGCQSRSRMFRSRAAISREPYFLPARTDVPEAAARSYLRERVRHRARGCTPDPVWLQQGSRSSSPRADVPLAWTPGSPAFMVLGCIDHRLLP